MKKPNRRSNNLQISAVDGPAPVESENPPSKPAQTGEITTQTIVKLVRDFMEAVLPKMKEAADADIIHFAKRFAPVFIMTFGERDDARRTPWGLARLICSEPPNVPLWALAVWKEAFTRIGYDIDKLKGADKEEIGKVFGLLESLQCPDSLKSLNCLETVQPLLDSWIEAMSRAEACSFYAGWKEGSTAIKRTIEQPHNRTKVIAAIALFWLEVEKMESAGQLQRWLAERHLMESGSDPAAEVRTICRMIDLSFREGSQGRPAGKSGLYKDG